MTPDMQSESKFVGIDEATKCLVRIAAAIAAADERTTRMVMEASVGLVDPGEVDEVILQSYLFAGFPRTLNAARAWRVASGTEAPSLDPDMALRGFEDWEGDGERTCHTVYGESYELLRENVKALHPALHSWMIRDGYGKVLSRSGLDLISRELCVVAACAASGQQRQLHSHLHGALNAGATQAQVAAALDTLADMVDAPRLKQYRSLLSHVVSRRHPPVEAV